MWDDDNQPRFIDDDDPVQDSKNDKPSAKSKQPNSDQSDPAKQDRKTRDARNGRPNRNERRVERAARAEQRAQTPVNHDENKASDSNGDQRRDVSPPSVPTPTDAPLSTPPVTPTPSAETPEPAPDDASEDLPASDIFMEIMRRAAATNASREERRRESEAKRAKSTDAAASVPPPPVTPPAPPVNAPQLDKADERPLWQQMRDYTPPTPLERALASLSNFATEEKVEPPVEDQPEALDLWKQLATPKVEPAPLTLPDDKSIVDQEADLQSEAPIETDLADDNTDIEDDVPPVVRPMTVRRPARASLVQSLEEVAEEVDEEQSEKELAAASDEDDEPTSEALPTHPLTDEERVAAAKLEAQRVRRVKKRQQQRRQRRVSVFGGILRSFLVVIPSALLMATILSWWTDPQFLRPEMRHNIQSAIIAEGATPIPPTAFPTPNWARLIGIVSGHSGPGQTMSYDPGAVCEDIESLNEHDINMQTAIQVVRKLRERGYVVDLLDEFDPRLNGYQAAALVSIHSNTCQDFGEVVSGFLVAKAQARAEGSVDNALAECIGKYYNNITQLERRFGLTEDMTDYHTFREIDVDTPAAIIELGFMREDRDILNEQPELMAEGIVQGIMCFLEPQLDTLPDPTASPTPS